MNGERYYLATYDPMNHVYATWLYNVANGLRMPFTNVERLGDIVEAGLGLLYLASMCPSSFAEIITNPNLMWRRIETSMESRSTWTSSIKSGRSKRKKVGLLLTMPHEVDDIKRIQSELEYELLILDPMRTEQAPPGKSDEVPMQDLQIQVPAHLGKDCQFCNSGTSALRCKCEVGLLLCTVWPASTEPMSQLP